MQIFRSTKLALCHFRNLTRNSRKICFCNFFGTNCIFSKIFQFSQFKNETLFRSDVTILKTTFGHVEPEIIICTRPNLLGLILCLGLILMTEGRRRSQSGTKRYKLNMDSKILFLVLSFIISPIKPKNTIYVKSHQNIHINQLRS